MQVKTSALLLAIGAATALGGCGDSLVPRAQFENNLDLLVVHPLNDSPFSLPVAIDVRTAKSRRVDANFNFDLAFDINDAGQVQVYPVRTVGNELVGLQSVGLQPADATFDEAIRAPTSGYQYDTTRVIPVGQTFFIDVISPFCTNPFQGRNIRGKFKVDSVANRAIFVEILSNPNCGFRSLVAGVPKD